MIRASGTSPYTLSEEVSCDWIRFGDLVALATSADAERDGAIAALTDALALVVGIPARSSRRFEWLDTEYLLGEITRKVVDAAVLLATLALEIGDLEVAHFAIAKGRILEPDAGALQLAEVAITSKRLSEANV